MIDKQVKKQLLTAKLATLKQQSGQQCQHVDEFNADFFERLGCVENSNFKFLQSSPHEQEPRRSV